MCTNSYGLQFTDYKSWLDACFKLKFTQQDLKKDQNEIWFEASNYKVASWDINKQIGWIAFN